jgi:hypothetical protein
MTTKADADARMYAIGALVTAIVVLLIFWGLAQAKVGDYTYDQRVFGSPGNAGMTGTAPTH